jgi:hypothetical protein
MELYKVHKRKYIHELYTNAVQNANIITRAEISNGDEAIYKEMHVCRFKFSHR